MFNYKRVIAFLLLAASTFIYGKELLMPIPIQIHLQNGTEKVVQVTPIALSDNEKQLLVQNVKLMLSPKMTTNLMVNPELKIQLGMNDVPVLDQGPWGTCATFATTAAVDALFSLAGSQTVSQLCNLELGRTLANPDESGGWDGSQGNLVLSQMNNYGFLTMQYQHGNGCGGLKEYPMDTHLGKGSSMPLDLFSLSSNKTFTKNDWKPLLSLTENSMPILPKVAEQLLLDVKKALLARHRVVFGTLLVPSIGEAGAVGTYNHIKHDTWILTPSIKKLIHFDTLLGAHEMIIDGFDDAACASYFWRWEKHTQCGLLHLRNSWSEQAGDKGDYYMSYDYFKTMVVEALEIGKQVN